jgi:hypothetical protein
MKEMWGNLYLRPAVFPVDSGSKFCSTPHLVPFRAAAAGLSSADLGLFYHAPNIFKIPQCPTFSLERQVPFEWPKMLNFIHPNDKKMNYNKFPNRAKSLQQDAVIDSKSD